MQVRIECPDSGMVLSVVKGDLFSVGKDVSLAHCISQDCRLGKGIAKIFRLDTESIIAMLSCHADSWDQIKDC